MCFPFICGCAYTILRLGKCQMIFFIPWYEKPENWKKDERRCPFSNSGATTPLTVSRALVIWVTSTTWPLLELHFSNYAVADRNELVSYWISFLFGNLSPSLSRHVNLIFDSARLAQGVFAWPNALAPSFRGNPIEPCLGPENKSGDAIDPNSLSHLKLLSGIKDVFYMISWLLFLQILLILS